MKVSTRLDERAKEKPTSIRVQELVDTDGVDVNLVRGELLDETLGLVEGQELGDCRKSTSQMKGLHTGKVQDALMTGMNVVRSCEEK